MAEFFNNKDLPIHCPKCYRVLLMADHKDNRVGKIACKHCKKWIWYIPSTGYREVRLIPERQASSGIRFY